MHYTDYNKKPIGGDNPYYCCADCGISDPQINGEIKGHAPHCSYRKRMEFITEHQNMENNESQHTSAPWKPARPFTTHIIDAEGRTIADVPHPNGMSSEEGYANRDLICAAPKLLAALEEANKDTILYPGHPGRYAQIIAEAKGKGTNWDDWDKWDRTNYKWKE